MKLLLLGSLLIISGFSYATAAAQSGHSQQSIDGNSGVAITIGGNASNVSITQVTNNYKESADYQALKQAFDKAKKYLDKNPSDPDFVRDFQIAKKELDDFTSQILKLAEDIEKIPLNSERGKKAKQLFEKGDYQAAREVLDAKEMDQEQHALLEKQQELAEEQEEIATHLKNLAGEYILKAKLTAVDYSLGEKRIPETRKYFEQALKSGRTPEHLFEYAVFLRINNQFKDAEKLFWEALDGCRKLAKVNPEKYRPYVAGILHNLGVVVSEDSGRHKEAEALYQEALTIFRDLAKSYPQVYRLFVAGALNDLGNLFSEDSTRHKKAEEFFQEALTIVRRHAKADPDLYAVTLNNLGLLLAENSSRHKEAEEFYQEALTIFRELANADPETYLYKEAAVFNNLGELVAKDRNRHKEAKVFYQEALKTYRELVKANSLVYQPVIAMTLNNLGNLVSEDSSYHKEAEAFHQEALKTYRELAQANPQVYRPDVANVLNSIGDTYLKWQQPEQAIPYLLEAHQLYIDLAKDAPEVFGEKVELVEKLLKQARGDK